MLKKSVFNPLIVEMIMKKRDTKLEELVKLAINSDPLTDASKIEITIHDGVVILSGSVDSYAKKLAAEHAVKSVNGVKEVVQKIQVRFAFKNKLLIYMGMNLVHERKHSYRNDADQPLALTGHGYPGFHFSRSGNEIW